MWVRQYDFQVAIMTPATMLAFSHADGAKASKSNSVAMTWNSIMTLTITHHHPVLGEPNLWICRYM